MASHESSSINNDDPSVDESTPLVKEKMRQLNKVVNKIDKHASTDKSTIEQLAFVVADVLTSESERETIFKIFKSFCNKFANSPSLGAAVFRDALKSIGYGESVKERSHLNSLNEFCDNESELEKREQFQKKFNFRAKLLKKGGKLDLSRPLNLTEDQVDCDPTKIKHLTVLQLLDQLLHATTISLDKEEESLAFLDGLIEAQCNAKRAQFLYSCKQAVRISVGFGFGFAFVLSVIGFVWQVSLPPVIVTYNQSIQTGDTIPVFLSLNASHLPSSYDLTPYQKINFELIAREYNIKVAFVGGAYACDPLPGHVTSKVVNPVPLNITPSHPILILSNQYYPQGSTLQGRLNITAGGNERGNVTLCIARSRVFLVPQDLVCFRSANYSILANSLIQLNYTISTPGYFDVYLMATASIEVDYQLNITYWYYNIQDYSKNIVCQLIEENNFDCEIELGSSNTTGCLIVYAEKAVLSPIFEQFKTHVTNKKASITILCISFIVLSVGCLLVSLCCCFWKYIYMYTSRLLPNFN